jgi:hypothetical protein
MELSAGELAGIIAVLGAFTVPILAILIQPMRVRARQLEQREARQSYERLVREKLDVIKTAVAMGYTNDQLSDLDARLERLVGTDKLSGLLGDSPRTPEVTTQLLDHDLLSEIQIARQATKSK